MVRLEVCLARSSDVPVVLELLEAGPPLNRGSSVGVGMSNVKGFMTEEAEEDDSDDGRINVNGFVGRGPRTADTLKNGPVNSGKPVNAPGEDGVLMPISVRDGSVGRRSDKGKTASDECSLGSGGPPLLLCVL